MKYERLSAEPNQSQRMMGYWVFTLVAMLLSLFFGFKPEGVDPLVAKGPEAVESLGGGKVFLLIGKAFVIALVCGGIGAWGFTCPRLYMIGTVFGVFAVIGGPIIWGSIHNMFWNSAIGPTIIVLALLSFVVAFFIMMKELKRY